MKILITGLNGFIGRSLKKLLSEKYQVLSLVRDQNNFFEDSNISNIIGDLSKPFELEWVMNWNG